MLDRIWQDHFLTVKMVKQLLLEESYTYQISYILQFFLKCDFQQKQHMSNRYFFSSSSAIQPVFHIGTYTYSQKKLVL